MSAPSRDQCFVNSTTTLPPKREELTQELQGASSILQRGAPSGVSYLPLPYVIVVVSVYQPVKGTPLRSGPLTAAGVALTREDISSGLGQHSFINHLPSTMSYLKDFGNTRLPSNSVPFRRRNGLRKKKHCRIPVHTFDEACQATLPAMVKYSTNKGF
jgi:hypothetical protein